MEKIRQFSFLRGLFVLGYVITIVLYFIPMYSYTNSPYFKAGETVSYLSVARAVSSSFPWRVLYSAIVFALNVLFIVLAFTYPKRLVFILGAGITCFFLIWGFFQASPGIKVLIVPLVFSYIGNGLKLIGFFIKPVFRKPGVATGA